MKRVSLLITALAVALCFGMPSAFGQDRGPGGPGNTTASGMGGTGIAGEMGHPGMMEGTHRNGQMGSQAVSNSSPTSLLSSNPKLASALHDRLGSMLPAGASLTDAASGFKNLGQFIAAVHVSHNLGIPFDGLKAKMTGGDKLGKAIKELKPDSDSKAEAKKAEKQAKADFKDLKS